MIGKTVSHYKILEKLGEGGMGEVFLAEDTKLDRKIALKFLPKELTHVRANGDSPRERFKREAKAAAALNHPNIVTIHEINEHEGQTYIAMEYVEGQTLKELITGVGAGLAPALESDESENQRANRRSPLQLDEIINITTQICEGLSKAHEAGIVHRDIKPQNILINKEGRIKILDFGLAKLKGVSQLSKEASTIGTTHYMSPEQSLGKEVDHRTDIWSLGVILYEMLTGLLPFKGEYDQAVIYSIINEEPEPVTTLTTGISIELELIIKKVLAKDPSKRYQHVDDLIEDLTKIKTDSKYDKYKTPKGKTNQVQKTMILGIILIAAIIITGYFIFKGQKTKEPIEKIISKTQWENSVAVLPFRDFSPKKDQEYFCDGMTDAIIGKLSLLKQLKIISLTSVLQYKNQARNIKKIGQELDVKTILEGSIQKEGNNIRVNAQLINITDDSHLWQNTYDRELKGLFAIQDEISQSIVNALRIELLREEKELLSKHHTQNIDAYHLYMQGRFFWRKRTEEGFKKSIEFYNKTLKVDPAYALAYAGLADTYSVMAWNRYLPQKQGFTKAKTAALKAIKLNNRLAEARNSLAYILLDYEWKFAEAKQEFEKAIQLNPGYANAYHWYARYFVYHGNLDKAISILKKALKLDPLSPSFNYFLAVLYYWIHQHDQAIILVKRGIDMHPGFIENHHLLGGLYMEKSMYEKAMDEFKVYEPPLKLEFYKLVIEADKGNTKKLEAFLDKYVNDKVTVKFSPSEKAQAYAWAGNIDKVFEWLEKAYETRDPQILYLRVIPQFKKYHTDNRFKNLLKKIGLEK